MNPTKPDTPTPDSRWQRQALRRAWPWLRRALILGFFAFVLWLVLRHVRQIQWAQVWSAMRGYALPTLLLTALCSVVSHATYAFTDLFARRHFQLPIGWWRTVATSFVCYLFNLNFGSWVGSIGFRYRLYMRAGIGALDVARIIGLALVTNWSGYLLVAGLCFAMRAVELPAGWEIGTLGLQLVGIGMLLAALAYLAACGWATRREFRLGGTSIALPGLRMALGQFALSSVHWLAIGGVLWLPMREHVDFAAVFATLGLVAIAGSATHIPGSIGITEGVFFAVLGDRMPHETLLAALLLYRGVFYLAPLLVAGIVYAVIEATTRARPVPTGLPRASSSGANRY